MKAYARHETWTGRQKGVYIYIGESTALWAQLNHANILCHCVYVIIISIISHFPYHVCIVYMYTHIYISVTGNHRTITKRFRVGSNNFYVIWCGDNNCQNNITNIKSASTSKYVYIQIHEYHRIMLHFIVVVRMNEIVDVDKQNDHIPNINDYRILLIAVAVVLVASVVCWCYGWFCQNLLS